LAVTQDEKLKQLHAAAGENFFRIVRLLQPKWVVPYANGLRFLNLDLIKHNAAFNTVDKLKSYNSSREKIFELLITGSMFYLKVVSRMTGHYLKPASEKFQQIF
jgi:hypothetical protein